MKKFKVYYKVKGGIFDGVKVEDKIKCDICKSHSLENLTKWVQQQYKESLVKIEEI